MENEPAKQETEIEALARLVKAGFDRMDERFEKVDERFVAIDQRFTDVNKRIDGLSYRVGQLDAKLDEHRQESKAEHAALRAVVGGLSHTLTDHEERIKMLEGE